jgi:CBS domain-containing protein
MTKDEILKLRAHLRRSFGSPAVTVTPNAREREAADVTLGERKIGKIVVDDEDGDRSFAFAMPIPVDRATLQDYLRKLFENDKLKIVARMKKSDSVELNNGDDFLGVVSADDQAGSAFTLQMAILDFDLEDL